MAKKSSGILTRLKTKVVCNLLTIGALVLLSGSGMSVYAQVVDPEQTPEDSLTEAAIQDCLEEQSSKMDEMLHLWYVQREIISANSVLAELTDDTTNFCHNDSLMAARLSKIVTVVPLAYNSKVGSFIELYSIRRKKSSAAMLGLAQYYFPWMQAIFDKYDVPEELIYLTIIESGLNPLAVSKAGATGIWQFMYQTGKLYGLEVNTFVDDRRDPYKATDAAARHLKDLYNMFGDWGLAISAYNCGAGNVRKAIARSGGKQTFWQVSPYLPRETQNYFPLYIGALYLMKYHNDYGIQAAKIAIPSAVDTIMVNKEMHLEQVSKVLNIDLDELKTLNPQYKRLIIPAYSQPYPIRLRVTDMVRFIEMQDSIHNYHYEEYFTPVKVYTSQFTGKPLAEGETKKIYYYVKSGDNLAKIAAKYNLSVAELKKMNKLNSNSVKVKQRLLVGYEYITPQKPVEQVPVIPTDSLSAQDSTATMLQAPVLQEKQDNTPVVYYVKKGDTLSSIAGRYNTTARKIADYNKLANMNALKIGQKLLIPRS